MGLYRALQDQIAKALQRAPENLASLVAAYSDTPPEDLASDKQLADRFTFLTQSLGSRASAVDVMERLIRGDELQPIAYLERGLIISRSVGRIRYEEGGQTAYATGFLAAPGVLITNNHVLPTADVARRATVEFNLELDVFNQPKVASAFGFLPERLFITSFDLDYAIVAVDEQSREGTPLSSFGFLPLLGVPGKAVDGEWLTIIQHPNGKLKEVCVRENKLLTRTDERLWYTTDTQAGSSGSPVCNNDWQVVALHHKGVPEMKDGRIQTLDGRDFDPARDNEESIKWVANEGIRVSRLVADLLRKAPSEPLLEPVFAMTPERAEQTFTEFVRSSSNHSPAPEGIPAGAIPSTETTAEGTPPMATRSITVTLDIADDGRVSVRPADGREVESLLERASGQREASGEEAEPADYDVRFDPDYSDGGRRKGYDPDYLGSGKMTVPLPSLGALEADAAPRLDKPAEVVLPYLGYSAVMHKTRKFAIYTAANVNGSDRHELGRPHDEWRFDPRLPRSAQVSNYYYAKYQFDRGHLTRYKDMQYGATPSDALEQAADTLHWTNCAAQHAKFNEGKQLWAGLELHILEGSLKAGSFKAQVFTGPVLDEGDPVWERYKDIQYPLRFWKIAVAPNPSGGLFAAGFVLDQSEVIDRYGIEATSSVPITAFKTFQVKIAEIERMTGLTFRAGAGAKTRLSEYDPLESPAAARRIGAGRSNLSAEESTAIDRIPPGYVPLETMRDIVRPQPRQVNSR